MRYQEESVWVTDTELSIHQDPDITGQYIEFVRDDETPPSGDPHE